MTRKQGSSVDSNKIKPENQLGNKTTPGNRAFFNKLLENSTTDRTWSKMAGGRSLLSVEPSSLLCICGNTSRLLSVAVISVTYVN